MSKTLLVIWYSGEVWMMLVGGDADGFCFVVTKLKMSVCVPCTRQSGVHCTCTQKSGQISKQLEGSGPHWGKGQFSCRRTNTDQMLTTFSHTDW